MSNNESGKQEWSEDRVIARLSSIGRLSIPIGMREKFNLKDYVTLTANKDNDQIIVERINK